MEAKHTKGNWKTKQITKNELIISIENYGHKDANYRKDNGCGHIATIKGWTGYSIGLLSDEDRANAKLIAASPQLLNACIKSLAALKNGYIEDRANATKLILEAIKAATTN